jgi:hypothetical protein
MGAVVMQYRWLAISEWQPLATWGAGCVLHRVRIAAAHTREGPQGVTDPAYCSQCLSISAHLVLYRTLLHGRSFDGLCPRHSGCVL